MLSTEEEIKALETRIAVLKKQKIDTASKQLMEQLEQQDYFRISRALQRNWFARLLGNKANSQLKHIGDKCALPLEGKRIDLMEVLPLMYTKLLELQRIADKSNAHADVDLKRRIQEEEYQNLTHKTQINRIELQEKVNKLIPRDLVRDKLKWLTSQLQSLGKRLYRAKTGPEAQTLLNEFLETLATECDRGGSLHV